MKGESRSEAEQRISRFILQKVSQMIVILSDFDDFRDCVGLQPRKHTVRCTQTAATARKSGRLAHRNTPHPTTLL